MKPSGLAGSTLVRVVHSPQECLDYISYAAPTIQKLSKNIYHKAVYMIAEEYIAGAQYSVNTYIDAAGKLTICPIIRIITPQELGINDSYSALQYTTEELTLPQQTALRLSLEIIIDRFQLRNTSAHFDAVLTKQGWKFFEVGLRIGGNRQDFFEKSHGFDHICNDINNRLGRPLYLPGRLKTACLVQTAATHTGTLREISIPRTIETARPVLIVEKKLSKTGKLVAPLSHGGGTITRHLLFGEDHETVVAACYHLFAHISFTID
jgi:hypothetical protein